MEQDQAKRDTLRENVEPQPEDQPMLYCPVCSLRLEQLKCKLFCKQCGYYMSCSDYY